MSKFVKTKTFYRMEFVNTFLNAIFVLILMTAVFFYMEKAIAEGLERWINSTILLKGYLLVSMALNLAFIASFWTARYKSLKVDTSRRRIYKTLFVVYRYYCIFTLVKIGTAIFIEWNSAKGIVLVPGVVASFLGIVYLIYSYHLSQRPIIVSEAGKVSA